MNSDDAIWYLWRFPKGDVVNTFKMLINIYLIKDDIVCPNSPLNIQMFTRPK